MKSLWNDADARQFENDPLAMRVYTSRLLGSNPELVLHGGGNTSVKTRQTNFFGEEEEILLVKGSGWNLGTIEGPGFAPVRMDALKKLAEMDDLSDSTIVREQRAALTDPYAPNPSIEAILHAIIPFTYVDHSHSDAIITLTNTADGEDRIREVFGESMVIVPYVMPGFILAKEVYEITRDADWSQIEGMVLMNHGLFTFGDDARSSYENHIRLVTIAEDYLKAQGVWDAPHMADSKPDLQALSYLRRLVSDAAGKPMIAHLNDSPEAAGFAGRNDIDEIANRGPLTPDHIIRTKRLPVILSSSSFDEDMSTYADAYQAYFERNASRFEDLTMLDAAPRWAVWPGSGIVAFGATMKAVNIVVDITRHTIRVIQWAEHIGGWQALTEDHLFEVEYWELEQAKLLRGGSPPPLQGKVALVTGAATGIGLATSMELNRQGAVVVGLDIKPEVVDQFDGPEMLGIQADMTLPEQVQNAIEETVQQFGGLDIIVSNAGFFPKSTRLEEMSDELWQRSLDLNVTSHRRLLTFALPYLKNGIDPAVIVVGSKNVPAPGPAQSAYSAAKAGLTQLARVAALEFGEHGIRVNVIHPNAVFDTEAWTEEIIATRAKSYDMTPQEYRTNSILQAEVSSQEVAELIAAMAGPLFAKTTGAQIPIDGGNTRVI